MVRSFFILAPFIVFGVADDLFAQSQQHQRYTYADVRENTSLLCRHFVDASFCTWVFEKDPTTDEFVLIGVGPSPDDKHRVLVQTEGAESTAK